MSMPPAPAPSDREYKEWRERDGEKIKTRRGGAGRNAFIPRWMITPNAAAKRFHLACKVAAHAEGPAGEAAWPPGRPVC